MCNISFLFFLILLLIDSRRALFARKFESPNVVSYRNELFFNGPLSTEAPHV
jgi:hypothetical protein